MHANRFLAALGLTTAILLSGTFGASAGVIVDVIASSTQGPGNDAHVFAGAYNGTTPAGATWSKDPLVTPPPGNVTNVYQSPFNNTPLLETQSFFSVGPAVSSGGAPAPGSLTFDTPQTGITMLWGSIDSYNVIKFLDANDVAIFSATGADINAAIGGGGIGPNFELVALLNVLFTDGDTFIECRSAGGRPGRAMPRAMVDEV